MQQFLGGPESGLLNLEAHYLALAIAKKTLDENCFRTARKQQTEKLHPSTIQEQAARKVGLKWSPGYQIVCIECDGHYLHIENQATGKQDHATSRV